MKNKYDIIKFLKTKNFMLIGFLNGMYYLRHKKYYYTIELMCQANGSFAGACFLDDGLKDVCDKFKIELYKQYKDKYYNTSFEMKLRQRKSLYDFSYHPDRKSWMNPEFWEENFKYLEWDV